MLKKSKKQMEFQGLPPVDPVFEQAETVLSLRRQIDDLKQLCEKDSALLAEMMLKNKKNVVRVDGIEIKLKVISAKTSFVFKQKKSE